MFTGTAIVEPFVEEELETTTAYASAITISLGDGNGAGSTDTINYTSGLGDFESGDRIRIKGSSSNDGDYTITTASSTSLLLLPAGSFTTEAAGERISITQIPKETTTPSVDSGDHVNCTRLVALAVVDYIKSQIAEQSGNIELKEYFMKEFWGKVADNKSNRTISGISVPRPTYAVI